MVVSSWWSLRHCNNVLTNGTNQPGHGRKNFRDTTKPDEVATGMERFYTNGCWISPNFRALKYHHEKTIAPLAFCLCLNQHTSRIWGAKKLAFGYNPCGHAIIRSPVSRSGGYHYPQVQQCVRVSGFSETLRWQGNPSVFEFVVRLCFEGYVQRLSAV